MLCHLVWPTITIIVSGVEHCIAAFGQCDVGVAEPSETRKHVILLYIPPCHPLRYVREQINNFIQPLSSLTVLCHGSYSTHLIANTFEIISETNPYSEEGCIDVILVGNMANTT